MCDKTIKTYIKYNSTLSFTDSSNVIVMENKNIYEIASYDHDFDKVDGIIRLS